MPINEMPGRLHLALKESKRQCFSVHSKRLANSIAGQPFRLCVGDLRVGDLQRTIC